jgi:predicted  nucleic acid-binding Zn-ribbon protein
MKIHLDYLEGRVEELENLNTKLEAEKKSFNKKLQASEDKHTQLKTENTKVVDNLNEKLSKL